MLGTVIRGIVELLWPPLTECLLCGTPFGEQGEERGVCRGCWSSMTFPRDLPRCSNCARPVSEPSDLCWDCAGGSPFGCVYALGLHAGPLRESIHHLKFAERSMLAEPLGRRLGMKIQTRYNCIVPVPLHRSRRRERGYNQAALIARGIAGVIGTPVEEEGLVRLRSTGHQAKLHRGERMRNLAGAFGVKSPTPPWSGRSVLLVDDVLTTGTTAAAAAGVLWRSGACQVDLAVLAVSTKPAKANVQNAP